FGPARGSRESAGADRKQPHDEGQGPTMVMLSPPEVSPGPRSSSVDAGVKTRVKNAGRAPWEWCGSVSRSPAATRPGSTIDHPCCYPPVSPRRCSPTSRCRSFARTCSWIPSTTRGPNRTTSALTTMAPGSADLGSAKRQEPGHQHDAEDHDHDREWHADPHEVTERVVAGAGHQRVHRGRDGSHEGGGRGQRDDHREGVRGGPHIVGDGE